MTWLAAFDRYWFHAAPARRLALLRIVTGLFSLYYLGHRYPGLVRMAAFDPAEFAPVGLARVLDAPLPKDLAVGLLVFTLAATVPFVLGLAYRVTAPVFALSFLWVTSYRSSWGMLFHTENLLALHLLVLAAAPAADALSLDARKRGPEPPAQGCYGWPARAMCWLTVVSYVLAGLAKLKLSGFDWLDGEFLRQQVAYDSLRKIELGSSHSELGAAFVRYEAPFRLLAPLTIALELGAPVALLGRRFALVWVVSAWLFHVGILALMAIPFRYQLWLVAYASFFELERWLDWAVARWRRLQARTRASSSATESNAASRPN
jgi:hypothetical protein